MTAEHTSCEFDPHATSMGDEAKHNVPAGDPGREEAQIARLRAMAKESSLDPEFAEKFLNFIISEVIRHHIRIAAEQQDPEQGENPASADHAE